MRTLLFAFVVGLGCNKTSTERPPVAGAPAPEAYRCGSPNDCALSNLRSDADCCGDPCESGRAYHTDQLTALQAKRAAHCSDKVERCPQADCDIPTNYYPGCNEATCVAIELPRRTECTSDADCELSCLQPKSCCGSCPCDRAWHRADLANAERWRADQCAAAKCPDNKCAAPTNGARCDNGWCLAK